MAQAVFVSELGLLDINAASLCCIVTLQTKSRAFYYSHGEVWPIMIGEDIDPANSAYSLIFDRVIFAPPPAHEAKPGFIRNELHITIGLIPIEGPLVCQLRGCSRYFTKRISALYQMSL